MTASPPPERRRFLRRLVGAGAGGLLAHVSSGALGQTSLAPTPACDDHGLTPAQTEGPFFLRNSPERAVLREAGMSGTPIVLIGRVLTRSCRPVAGALVELWHADVEGVYDVRGNRLRGHQFTGPDGGYRFATIVPGLYPGRTRHFHLKYRARPRPTLTTQLYFPNEPANRRDWIFRPELIMDIEEGPEWIARFDAVLNLA